MSIFLQDKERKTTKQNILNIYQSTNYLHTYIEHKQIDNILYIYIYTNTHTMRDR